jgi:hypothetical protein
VRTTREEVAKVEEPRRRRSADHGRGRLKLSVPKMPGYYTRWVTDVGTRIHDFTVNDDYDFVSKSEINDDVGESGDGNTDVGSRVRVLVDKDAQGNPIHQYLLKKPAKFHKEDMREKEAIRQEQESALRRGSDQIENQYGSIK